MYQWQTESEQQRASPLVLLVEDDDVVRHATSQTLRLAGFEVIEAATGAKALEMARQQPDLIVLDVKLPDVDGFEVCRWLRSDPATVAIPILQLSGVFSDDDSRVRGLEGGANGYLLKPITAPVLIAYIKSLLRTSRAEKESRAKEEMLSALCEAALDAVVLMDSQGKAQRWNHAAEKMFGYGRDEILGREIHEVLAPQEYRERARNGLSHFAKTGEGPILGRILQMRALRKDGSEFPIELSLAPMRHQNKWWSVAIIRDITERKQAEMLLTRRTRQLNERVKELNCLYGISKDIANNPASTEQMLREIVARIPLAMQYPEIACARIILEQGAAIFDTRNFNDAHGKLSAPIMVHGQQAGILEVGYLRQPPEAEEGQFLAEEQALINAICERLGKAIARRWAEAELRRAKAAVEAAILAKSESLDDTSHDVRTSMTAILNWANLLLGEHTEGEALEAPSIIKDYAENVLAILDSRSFEDRNQPVAAQ